MTATASQVKTMATPLACPNVLYKPIPGQSSRRLPIQPPSSDANSERQARLRGFLISSNHQEFWRLLPVMRTQFFAAVTTWIAQKETPIGFSTGGSLVA